MLTSRALALFLVAAAGCNPLTALRRLVHGDAVEKAQQVAADKAGMTVEVTPPQGISILLDDARVASQSPFVAFDLAPGPHTLHVRGMGFFSMTLPLMLQAGAMAKVPVSLRPRVSAAPTHVMDLSTGEPGDEEAPPPLRPDAPTPPPEIEPEAPMSESFPELPVGLAPIDLHLIAQPPTPVMVDGAHVEGRSLRVGHLRGKLQIGVLSLPYRVTAGRVLEMKIPPDGAIWSKDGVQLKAGTAVRLSYGATRIRRLGSDGTDQSIVLRRVN